jgi:vacuolar-type H+-ATPase subunit I/STV1
MSENKQMFLLKLSIFIGLVLLLTGIYFHNYSEFIDSLGANGIIISASCIALGFIFSLPTKMYLTFLLVKREANSQQNHLENTSKNASSK